MKTWRELIQKSSSQTLTDPLTVGDTYVLSMQSNNDSIIELWLDGTAEISRVFTAPIAGSSIDIRTFDNPYIKNTKLESGTSATFWTYSHEDIDGNVRVEVTGDVQFYNLEIDTPTGVKWNEVIEGSYERTIVPRIQDKKAQSIIDYGTYKYETEPINIPIYANGKIEYAVGTSEHATGTWQEEAPYGVYVWERIGTIWHNTEMMTKARLLQKRFSECGSNLLRDSGVKHVNSNYIVAEYETVETLVEGELYTLSVCIPSNYVTNHFVPYVSEVQEDTETKLVDNSGRQIVTRTFRMEYMEGRTPDVSPDYSNIIINRFPLVDDRTGDCTVFWAKLEKGDKATPWCPSISDEFTVRKIISDKFAFSEVSYDDFKFTTMPVPLIEPSLGVKYNEIKSRIDTYKISVRFTHFTNYESLRREN